MKYLKKLYRFLHTLCPTSILDRYIFTQIFPYFFMGVFIFSLVNFIQYLSDFVDLAVQYQSPLISVLRTVIYLIPFLMTFTIPVGVLIGIVLIMGNLVHHNEILTMRINGVSFLRIIKPVVFFGVLIFLFQLMFFQWVLPWGNYHFIQEKYKMMQKNPISQIEKTHNFSDGVHELKVANISDSTVYGVSLVDSSTNTLYYAKKGAIEPSIDQNNINVPITLYNATALPYIYDIPNIHEFPLQFFDQITVYLRMGNISSLLPYGDELMSLSDLKYSIKNQEWNNVLKSLHNFHHLLEANYKLQIAQNPKEKETLQNESNMLLNVFHTREAQVHTIDKVYTYQKKLSFAFDVIIMTFVAIPLAIFRKRSGKDMAIGLAIICIFLFNALIVLGSFLFSQHIFSAVLSAWFPSICMTILSATLVGIRYKNF